MNSSSCPVAAFRFNQSAAEAWFTHEWSNAALESEDIGTIVIGILLLAASVVVLLKGESLVKPTFFLVGSVGALIPAFAAVDAILAALSLSPALDCTLLIAIPIAIAIAAGFLMVCFLTLAFVVLGLVSGGALGYYMYVLFLHYISSPVLVNGYTVVFALSVGISGLVGGILSYKLKHGILILATSVVGAVGSIVALDFLVLGRIDRNFLWLIDARSAAEHLSSPFVFGPIVACAFIAAGGFFFQRHQKEKRRFRAYTQPLIRG